MEPLGSFLPALNALLQLRVPILDLGYRYSLVKTHSKNVTVVKGVSILVKRVSILGYGYRYLDRVSILKNLTGIMEMVLHKTGYRYSRVGNDTHLGYRYSIRVSVLKNHSGILEVFQNLTGYRYSMKGIGTLC
ncbi:hypothetical protein GQ457_04G021220 [Hibiscus cannabinus]